MDNVTLFRMACVMHLDAWGFTVYKSYSKYGFGFQILCFSFEFNHDEG